MKYTTLVLCVIAAACAAASIYIGAQLAEAQEQLAQEAQARGAGDVRIRQLEGEVRRLEAELSQAPPGLSAATVSGSRSPTTLEQRPSNAAQPGGPMPRGSRDDGLARVSDTPAAQNTRRLQQEIRLRRRYADMPAVLGLDAAQAEKMFDLLTDSQLAAANDARAYSGDPAGARAVEAASLAQRDASIEALLGPDKAAEFQSFEKSIPARMQVGRIDESMTAANVPLTAAQKTSLIAAVASEQESRPPPARPVDGNYDSDYEARFLDWQADYSRRVQARVEPLLTAEQAAHYRQAVEVQNARRADARARAEQRRGTSPGRQ